MLFSSELSRRKRKTAQVNNRAGQTQLVGLQNRLYQETSKTGCFVIALENVLLRDVLVKKMNLNVKPHVVVRKINVTTTNMYLTT